jgi:hypothetical protein
MSVIAILLLAVHPVYEGMNVLGLPYGSAGAKLDGFWESSSFASFPPRAFADGEESKDLPQTEKTC